MNQRELNFAIAERRPVLVRYSPEDRKFFAATPLAALPASFLIESRAQRMKCSPSDLRAMKSYELARELADEVAILGSGSLDETCRIQAVMVSDAMIEAGLKSFVEERVAAWKEFLLQKSKGVA